jgi:hypothetical protein
LESIVWCTGVRAERLLTNPAQISTTLPGVGLVEAMEDDASGTGISRQRAFPVWTADTLHCSRTLWIMELIAWN